MFSPSTTFILLALVTSALGQFPGEGRLAAPLALFFYYGYLNEFSAHDGWTTIGGRECRETKCTFDQFLGRTTRSGGLGGYQGGQTIDDRLFNRSIKELAESLQRRGLNAPIGWDRQKLITGAPSDSSVYEDHMAYVLNAFNEDRSFRGHQQNYHDKAIDALTMMAELNAEQVSRSNMEWWRDTDVLPPDSDGWNIIHLPVDNDADVHSVGRDAIDLVNLVKTWIVENPLGARVNVEDFPFRNPARPPTGQLPNSAMHLGLGYNWAELRLAVAACRSGQPYPFSPLPPIDVIPYNWPGGGVWS